MSLIASMVASSGAIEFPKLGLSPTLLHIGWFQLRWYSIAYLAGIFIGYWYLLKLLKEPGAPMARRHADDLVFYAALGIIFGGRLGYVLFYNLTFYLAHPLDILKLWDGGMSFHGGVIGTSLGILYLARKEKLPWLRIHDYVACCVPFGLFFGRLANFVNQELWGAPTDVPWGIRFVEYTGRHLPGGEPETVLGPARHPASSTRRAWRGCYCSRSSGSSSGGPRPVTSRVSWSGRSSCSTGCSASASSSSASPTAS
jgi:phosphatidylglycerol:prolipoprotein diacylglycerol transferase